MKAVLIIHIFSLFALKQFLTKQNVLYIGFKSTIDMVNSFPPTIDTERKNQTILDKQEAFIFFYKWKTKPQFFIHYNPDYAQSSILSAQFKSKVIRIRI